MKPHEEWLFKADQNFESSRLLASSEKCLYDIAVYHAQQCAEKALKSFLAYHFKEISKVHSLLILLDQCLEIDSSLENLYEDCMYLNPYSTLYRYPEGELLPEKYEVDKAIKSSEKILSLIREKMTSFQ